jgi:cytochrome c-type biogenesis protein
MTVLDIVFGFLAGILSCVTPEALLLFPVLLSSAAAVSRLSLFASAVGLGLSLVLTGVLAVTLGASFGFEAKWLRWIVCVLLFLQGIDLMSEASVERLAWLTGGKGSLWELPESITYGVEFRQFLLAFFVGANWIPRVGPTLGKASMMAANAQSFGLAMAMLFMFGMGAAVPWIFAGRVIRRLVKLVAARVLTGMIGLRILGLALLTIAGLGIFGLDIPLLHWIDTMAPVWTRKLAVTF